MKKLFFILTLCVLCASAPAMANYPENEAEFLYGNKSNSNSNSNFRYDYTNQHIYMKGYDNSYIRDDGATVWKSPSGVVENSYGKSYMPVAGGSMYVPMDL
jgi:hypothetical protein